MLCFEGICPENRKSLHICGELQECARAGMDAEIGVCRAPPSLCGTGGFFRAKEKLVNCECFFMNFEFVLLIGG